MFAKVFTKVFGSRNSRTVKRLQKKVTQINALEEECETLSDDALRAKTEEFKSRVQAGESLDDLLVEAFAVVREAGKRVLEMRHFDEQLLGGMVLHEGNIAEMRTGEGKTLVATLAAYLNALSGEGVHVITVNDYLARRDAEWMGQIYEFLGLSVGVILGGMEAEEKRAAYASDIIYGTNNEFGFDYLRDNMAFSLDQKMQRKLNFAIVDEVDSILIDEARTPLIISGPAEDSSELYKQLNGIVPKLSAQAGEESEGDFYVDEKARQVFLSEQGHEHVEQLLIEAGIMSPEESLYGAENVLLLHHLNAALRAHTLFKKNVDYIVRNGKVVIVDEFTGRTMPGRRWSEGLHQAVEAKEGVSIQQENQTLAAITFQNYFRMYNKLSGMTGTADTEAFEFQQIYDLEVVVIPTHKAMVREDLPDLVLLSAEEKYDCIVEDIKERVAKGQPVLVGTASIDSSELLYKRLTQEKIEHQVLNAKFHEKEAEIIAQAGRPGHVTIATNMAGRGTDIVLGGSLEADLAHTDPNDEVQQAAVKQAWQKRHDAVLQAGGLHVIGSERHESRRVDNQLRGRSGRQGDPGSSRFFVSLEDNLMRIFASERVSGLMQRLGMEEGEAIEHPWVTKAIENAQRKVEGRNFDIRKQLLEYDDVSNEQRKVIYEQRDDLLQMQDISETITEMRSDVVNTFCDRYIPPQSMEEQWDLEGLQTALAEEFGATFPLQSWLDEDAALDEEGLRNKIVEQLENQYQEKEERATPAVMRDFERHMMLQILDKSWKEHLAMLDHLRQGIHFRGYAQKNPKQEYKREAFELFQNLLDNMRFEVISIISKVQVQTKDELEQQEIELQKRREQEMQFRHAEQSAMAEAEAEVMAAAAGDDSAASEQRPYVRTDRKVGRNEPCPCGSGKKYKQCHGQLS